MLTVKRLPSGVLHVRGTGPCNWAHVTHWDIDFFPEAGESFRHELRMQIDNIPVESYEPGAGEIVIEDGKVKA